MGKKVEPIKSEPVSPTMQIIDAGVSLRSVGDQGVEVWIDGIGIVRLPKVLVPADYDNGGYTFGGKCSISFAFTKK